MIELNKTQKTVLKVLKDTYKKDITLGQRLMLLLKRRLSKILLG